MVCPAQVKKECPYCYAEFTGKPLEPHCKRRECYEQHVRQMCRRSLDQWPGRSQFRKGVDWAVPHRDVN